VSVDDFDLLADYDVPKYGEEGKDRRKGGLAIDDKEGYMIDLEAIGQIANASSASIGMRYDDDFVPTIYQFLARHLSTS
jgi:hypothetical protein